MLDTNERDVTKLSQIARFFLDAPSLSFTYSEQQVIIYNYEFNFSVTAHILAHVSDELASRSLVLLSDWLSRQPHHSYF